jgi:hypothetical protein
VAFTGLETYNEIEAHRDAVAWQPSLLAIDDPAFDPGFSTARRRFLGQGAWVDVVPDWASGADTLFDQVLESAQWKAYERPMYERIVDVPRLSATAWQGRPRLLERMASCLGLRYSVDLPAISANLYRDGHDSVAWHGDRIGRVRSDAVVAILSLGSDRTLLLRPNGGGRSIALPMHSGDLVVQGGTCQRTFEHCVPKRAHAGPRISVMFRQEGGN